MTKPTDRESQIIEMAEKYSEDQFKSSNSFHVEKGVCNDSIFEEAFVNGAVWADENPLKPIPYSLEKIQRLEAMLKVAKDGLKEAVEHCDLPPEQCIVYEHKIILKTIAELQKMEGE